MCGGKGRAWGEEVAARAGVTGQTSLKNWAPFGIIDAGDLMLSIGSDTALYAMGAFDRVLMLDRSEPFSQTVISGVTDLTNFRALAVDRVCWKSGDALVDGPLPVVAADGRLDWGLNEPPAGVTYSITGRRIPEFYAFLEIPLDRPHHGGLPLPRRVVVRRFDLYGR